MLALVQAWFRPHATLAKWRANLVVSWAILGGIALMQLQAGGRDEPWRILVWLVPAATLSVMQVAVAQWGRVHAERQLHELRLLQERDASAREAAESRLAVLKAQIQPHFIFNTLAALQHWVDSGDARAAPLLRDLTSFLRGSTELMARDEIALAEELPLARHYLAIMQARLGERLQIEIDADEAALAQRLPPGLLLTLVENAVEHGVAPLLREAKVHVSARRDATHFELAVQDNGPGPATDWKEGVGLANLHERLARRFGTGAGFTLRGAAPGARAEIRIDMRGAGMNAS
jgi:LytS/YehU family sensor histidine kinase